MSIADYLTSMLIHYPHKLAARMESTGIADLVQVSQATADLLVKEGRGHWIRQRENIIEAKGKGLLRTYWMNPNFSRTETSMSNTISDGTNNDSERVGTRASHERVSSISKEDNYVKRDRMVDWMVELLLEHIKTMVRTFISQSCIRIATLQ